jgi:hypothetical protein
VETGKKRMERRESISIKNILKKDWVYPLIIILLGFFYYLSYIRYGVSLKDEGFLVYGSERVLHGQLPMSDFTSYPPGRYFLLGLLFKLFGVNLVVSRFMEMAFLLLNGLMMFYIGKRLMPSGWAIIPSFILILFPGPWHKVFFTFGLLLPLLTLFRFLERENSMRILIVGWAIGIALILKIESALYSFLTVWIVLFLKNVLEAGKLSLNKTKVLAFLREISLCSSALLSVIVPVIIFYHSRSALTKLFSSLKECYGSSLISTTSELFGQPSLLRALTKFHIGSMSNHFFFLIVLLYIYFFLKVVVHLFGRKKGDFPPFFPVLVTGTLSLTYAYTVFEKAHLLQSVAMAYILFGFAAYSVKRKEGIKSKIFLIILLLLLGLYCIDNFKWSGHFYSGSISRLYMIEKEGVGVVSSNKGKVYVGKRESDTINNLMQFFRGKNGYLMPLHFEPMVNFLTGLENPTPFLILSPPFFGNPIKQKQVIEEVEKYRIQYLLVPQILWVHPSGYSYYAPMLYKYVMKCYQLEREVGGYLIFSRQSL